MGARKARGRAWGNALGGYKKQKRVGGKFSSGFVGSVGSPSLTPAARRAQFVERKSVRDRRRKTAKKVAIGAGVVALGAGAAYAAGQSPTIRKKVVEGRLAAGLSADVARQHVIPSVKGHAKVKSEFVKKKAAKAQDVVNAADASTKKVLTISATAVTAINNVEKVKKSVERLTGKEEVWQTGVGRAVDHETRVISHGPDTAEQMRLANNARMAELKAQRHAIYQKNHTPGQRFGVTSPSLAGGTGHQAAHAPIGHSEPAINAHRASRGQLYNPGMNRPMQKKAGLQKAKFKGRDSQFVTNSYENVDRLEGGRVYMRSEDIGSYNNDDAHERLALAPGAGSQVHSGMRHFGTIGNSAARARTARPGTVKTPQASAQKNLRAMNMSAADVGHGRARYREKPVSDFNSAMNVYHPGMQDLQDMELHNVAMAPGVVRADQMRRDAIDRQRNKPSKQRLNYLSGESLVSGRQNSFISGTDLWKNLSNSQRNYVDAYEDQINMGIQPNRRQKHTYTALRRRAVYLEGLTEPEQQLLKELDKRVPKKGARTKNEIRTYDRLRKKKRDTDRHKKLGFYERTLRDAGMKPNFDRQDNTVSMHLFGKNDQEVEKFMHGHKAKDPNKDW